MSATARFRYTLVAGATAVVIGTGFTLAGVDRQISGDDPSARAATAPLAAEAAPPGAPLPDGGLLPSADAAPTTLAPSPSATPSTPAPRATTSRPASRPKPRASRTTATSQPRPKAPSVPKTSGSVVDRVLGHINAARADEGLPALRLDDGLSRAAALHNRAMIDGCGLDHQCPGESGLGERFSAQGVRWSSAGENIGFGSAGSSDSAIAGAANGLTDSMLAETPPNDGHRKNLLNRGFERIGLSVVRDGDGRVWMTQDFVG
jgi:uncharacterized protein YkwD